MTIISLFSSKFMPIYIPLQEICCFFIKSFKTLKTLLSFVFEKNRDKKFFLQTLFN